MIIVNTVIYVRDLLGRGSNHVAIAFAASGAGAMITALALPALLDRINDRPDMLTGGGLIGAGLALSALTASFAALLGRWFVLGVGLSLVQTPAGRLLQRSASPTDRPALFAAQFSLSHACWLLTYPLAGLLGAALGLLATSTLLAALATGALLVAARAWPADDPAVIEHTHEPLEHNHAHVHDTHGVPRSGGHGRFKSPAEKRRRNARLGSRSEMARVRRVYFIGAYLEVREELTPGYRRASNAMTRQRNSIVEAARPLAAGLGER